MLLWFTEALPARCRRPLSPGSPARTAPICHNSCWSAATPCIGLLRRSASADVIGERLRWLGVLDRVTLHDGDLIDLSSLLRIVQDGAAGRGL